MGAIELRGLRCVPSVVAGDSFYWQHVYPEQQILGLVDAVGHVGKTSVDSRVEVSYLRQDAQFFLEEFHQDIVEGLLSLFWVSRREFPCDCHDYIQPASGQLRLRYLILQAQSIEMALKLLIFLVGRELNHLPPFLLLLLGLK